MKYIVELNVIGFVGPVKISVETDPDAPEETDDQIINTALECLTQSNSRDASVISLTKLMN